MQNVLTLETKKYAIKILTLDKDNSIIKTQS